MKFTDRTFRTCKVKYLLAEWEDEISAPLQLRNLPGLREARGLL